jgi:hypothetical protein
MRTKRVDDTSNAFHFHPLWVVRIAFTTTCTLRWWLSIIINALRASLVAYTSIDDSDKTTTLTVIFLKVVLWPKPPTEMTIVKLSYQLNLTTHTILYVRISVTGLWNFCQFFWAIRVGKTLEASNCLGKDNVDAKESFKLEVSMWKLTVDD